MKYRIACSDEEERYFYYCRTEDAANTLFNMAIKSKFFNYVEVELKTEGFSTTRIWEEKCAR